MLAPGGHLPVETVNTLGRLLGTPDALSDLENDYRKLLLVSAQISDHAMAVQVGACCTNTLR
jgi:hypothetical protein